MYGRRPYGEKSFRGRGRGGPRGRRPTPYSRHEREDSDLTIPKATPDHMLPGASTSEQAKARAKDDARVARDWQTWNNKYFERDEYTLPRPAKSHKLPDATTINETIDSILTEAKASCKTAIDAHLQHTIEKAAERERNPPASATDVQLQQWMERMEQYKKTSILNVIATMTRAAQEIHTSTTQDASNPQHEAQ